jgi:hypothetical protein
MHAQADRSANDRRPWAVRSARSPRLVLMWALRSARRPRLVPTWALRSARSPPLVPTWAVRSARSPPMVPTWALRSARSPPLVPTWALRSARSPPMVPTWALRSARSPPLVPTWALRSARSPPLVPTWALRSARSPPLVPTWALRSREETDGVDHNDARRPRAGWLMEERAELHLLARSQEPEVVYAEADPATIQLDRPPTCRSAAKPQDVRLTGQRAVGAGPGGGGTCGASRLTNAAIFASAWSST